MGTAYLVNHTHWDREWYFSAMDSLVLSDQIFTNVLQALEENPAASFCLDGQTSILSEYLTLYPEKSTQVKELLQQKRLFTGPWYTQTDGLIPRGESILRNLMVGVRDAERLGGWMRIGYLPDTFGFNAQMPTLLQAAGIDSILLWRGIEFNQSLAKPYFRWKGLGSKEVFAASIPQSYSAASFIEATQNYADKRIKPMMDFHEKLGEPDVLIPSGGDQLNVVPDFPQMVADLAEFTEATLKASSYPEFFQQLKEKELPVYQGDFRIPKYTRVHRTIGSVRYKIKHEAQKVESKLLQRIEPLMVLAKKLHIDLSTELLVTAWKKLLESQAHDSLGGCVTDSVADDILHRLKEADELCDGIENTILFQIFAGAHLADDELLLVNPEAQRFEGEKELTLVVPDKQFRLSTINEAVIISETYYPERKNVLKLATEGHQYITEPAYYVLKLKVKVELPAFGYRVVKIEQLNQQVYAEPVMIEETAIENETIRLSFENSEVILEQNGRRIENFLTLTTQGNNGDTYDFSPLEQDQELELHWQTAQVQQAGTTQTMILAGTADVPRDLSDRLTKQQLVPVSYQLHLRLQPGQKRIDGQIFFDNQVYSHRLRLKINTQIATECSIPQVQVGFQTKKNQPIMDNWQEHYVEKPVNIYNFQRTVTHTDQADRQVTFFAKDLYEYEVAENQLFITLLCTTGQFGKPDLAWRPGRASGDTTMMGHTMIETPAAQEIGANTNSFALYLDDHWSEQAIIRSYREWDTPSIAYQKQQLNLFLNRLDNKLQSNNESLVLPKQFSAFELETTAEISSISPSLYDEEYFVVRFANHTGETIDLAEAIPTGFTPINALEEVVESEWQIPSYDLLSIKGSYSKSE